MPHQRHSHILTQEPCNKLDYDNMRYRQVYDQGPTDAREPLYHSEPFWIELNAQQTFKSKVATFIDNYSHLCMEFAVNNAGRITTGTRFGAMQYYIIAGNDFSFSEFITSHNVLTSMQVMMFHMLFIYVP